MAYDNGGSGSKSAMVPLAALWWQRSENGTEYLSGKLGDAKLLCFKNTRKTEGSREPDFRIFVVEAPRDKGNGGQQGGARR